MFHHFAGADAEWGQRSGVQNRKEKSELIRRGQAQGFLAYVGGRPVGWCHAAPRSTLPGLDRIEEFRVEDAEGVGSIVCFVIAAPYRGQGIARQLLDAACAGFRSRGLTVAEAYPLKRVASDALAFHGPLEMYLAAGFSPYRETTRYVIVRKPT
jgi:GNAT superfamily N-acetyltransferase